MLSDRGYGTLGLDEQDPLMRDLKESNCYVPMDFEEETKRVQTSPSEFEKTYELPDGKIITLDRETFTCPEALFWPYLAEQDVPGIHESILQSIESCHIDTQKELFSNIVLSGGSTQFQGLPERLSKEVGAIAPHGMKVRVHDLPDRVFMPWLGGAILSSLSTFQTKLMTKADFEEVGASLVHKKCDI
jgi:actin-related protein